MRAVEAADGTGDIGGGSGVFAAKGEGCGRDIGVGVGGIGSETHLVQDGFDGDNNEDVTEDAFGDSKKEVISS